MTFTKLAASAALATTLVATGALAEDRYSHFGSVEGWNVFTDHEKKSCFIESKDDFGNVVQMGLTRDRGVAYIGVFTTAETDIKKGQKEGVAVVLGDNVYVGEATGMRGNITEGYSGGYVLTDDAGIIEQIQKQREMVVFPEKAYGFIMDLTGTFKAIEMGKECNAAAM
ncbi:hypothetical protein [uncultured Shimia sp.]|uniref:hypothetical protein n=1 Tax=uncultured Shimia sp. TaxID=573152 RepID=UPI00260E501D|nr:hypothetical protein [uncultured Shimia sp.]